MAPEIRDRPTERIHEKSDVYSLAMTMYTLWTGRVPFHHLNEDEAAADAARKGARPDTMPTNAHPSSPYIHGGLYDKEKVEFGALLTQMWHHDPRCNSKARG